MSVAFARKRLEQARAALPDTEASTEHLIAAAKANLAAHELGTDEEQLIASTNEVARFTLTDWARAAIDYATTIENIEQRGTWYRFMHDMIGAAFGWFASEAKAGHTRDVEPVRAAVTDLLSWLDRESRTHAKSA